MALLCQHSLKFIVVNNFDRELYFQICYVVLNLPCVFFQIYTYYRPFFLLTFLNINGTSTLHTNLTTGIPQQSLSCSLDVLVNFRQIFALLHGTFIVEFEYYLFMVNATL